MSSQRQNRPTCGTCGIFIAQPTTGRPRRFCSTSCRQADYRARRDAQCAAVVRIWTEAGEQTACCRLTIGEHRKQPERPCEAVFVAYRARQTDLAV